MLVHVFESVSKFLGKVQKVAPFMFPTLPNLGQWDAEKPAAKPTQGDLKTIYEDQYNAAVSAGNDEQAKAIRKQIDALDAHTESIKNLDKAVQKTTGNDFYHFNLATDAATQGFTTFLTAMQQASAVLGKMQFGLGAGGLSDVPGAVYEEYPWEGHSSQYGPEGQDLSQPGEVGLGPDLMAKKGLRQGDWVTFPGHPELGK